MAILLKCNESYNWTTGLSTVTFIVEHDDDERTVSEMTPEALLHNYPDLYDEAQELMWGGDDNGQ